MKKYRSIIIIASAALLAVTGCSRRDKSGRGEKGGRVVLQNKGSDTLVNVAQAWAEAYKKVDASVAIAVSGGGSGTGISSLINGTVDLANSSRSIKDKEKATAEKKGVKPVEHIVGYDALAVYLHKGNPIESLSLSQLAGIYGEGGEFNKWSDLDVKVPGCDSDEIVRVSRQNNSGTYVYFKKIALAKKEYKLGSRDMHGSKDVVDLVAKTPCAIGYSGLAYAVPEIKMPCITKEAGAECVAPSVKAAVDRSYPIARPLFMYTNGTPEGATKKYLDWVMSDAGQCIMVDKGYAPAKQVTCT